MRLRVRSFLAALTLAGSALALAIAPVEASSIYGTWPTTDPTAKVGYGYHYGIAFVAVPDANWCDSTLYYLNAVGQPQYYTPYAQASGAHYPGGGSTLQFWCNESFYDQSGVSHTCYPRYNVPPGGANKHGFWGAGPDPFCTGNTA